MCVFLLFCEHTEALQWTGAVSESCCLNKGLDNVRDQVIRW
jgi:hypothetical protein